MKVKGTPHDKLHEAEFFVRHLRHSDWSDPDRPDEFDYYMSAFLAAAESVIEVLRKTQPTFGVQFTAWKASLSRSDHDLFEFMVSTRDEVVHRAASSSAREITDVSMYDWINQHADRVEGTVDGEDVVSRLKRDTISVTRHYVSIGDTKIDARDACLTHVGLLRDLLGRFVRYE